MPASERIGPAYAAMMSMTSHRDRGLPPATRGYCKTIYETIVARLAQISVLDFDKFVGIGGKTLPRTPLVAFLVPQP